MNCNFLGIIFLAFLAAGCSPSPRPDANLGYGYKIWTVSSNERYISDDNDVFIFGPGVSRVAIEQDNIIACCEEGEIYLMIDLTSGAVVRGKEEDVKLIYGDAGGIPWRLAHEFY